MSHCAYARANVDVELGDGLLGLGALLCCGGDRVGTAIDLERRLKPGPRSAHEQRGGTHGRLGGTTGGRRGSQICYYESIGLLPEPDRLYGQRRYDTDVLGRLALIVVVQSAGFKLSEIND